MSARSRCYRDLAFAGGLLVLLLLFFWPTAVGGSTLLPADVLYQWQPWKSQAPAEPFVVRNGLPADLVVENYVWKRFIVECLRTRQLPLWNPYILSGQPFLAAGQHSALYPFSLIFYILPLPRAYGLFTVTQLFVAGLCLYYFARTIRLSRFAAAAGGLVYVFSGFFLVSTGFPMIIAAAAWLPLLLAMVERLVQAAAVEPSVPWRERLRAPLPWLVLGSLALGLQFLAGHAEPSYYSLLVLGAYAVWRAVGEFVRHRRWPALLLFAACLAVMLVLGAGLGAAQTIPFYELARQNFREGSQPYEQIVSYRYPLRRLLAFLMPDFFGNPTHHSYVDLYTGQTVTTWTNALGQARNTIDWGIKNYVEGGCYISILGLALALVGLVRRPRSQAWFFGALGLFSLSLVFGLPTYRLVFALPGIRQLHSPFRWVYPYTLCMAVLAAMGVEALVEALRQGRGLRLPAWLGIAAVLTGVGAIAALGLARAFPGRILPLADRAVAALVRAPEVFSDGRMFVSYEARNLLLLAACALAAGTLLLWPRLRRPGPGLRKAAWPCLLLAVLVLDPALWLRSFQPVADPATLGLQPAEVGFLQREPGPFRITTYDTQSEKPLPENTGMLFGLQDIRGYDSIITKPYAEVMQLIEPQELDYNRISRLTRPESLDSPILDLLNVRYILTEETIDKPGFTLVHDGDLRVYRHEDALPRASVTFQAQVFPSRQSLLDALRTFDPRGPVLLEQAPESFAPPQEAVLFTVSGEMLAPNVAGGCAIEGANSAPYLSECTVDDPTVEGRRTGLFQAIERFLGLADAAREGQVTYRGLLLSDIWNRCGAVASEARVTAADGRQVTIPAADLLRWPILIATQLDGKALTPEQGGRAKLVFPPEAAAYPAGAWLTAIETVEFVGTPVVPPSVPPVEYLEMSPNQVQLRVDMPAPGFLVLADSWAPGWVAYTTPAGQESEEALTLLRADGTVRAVQLPAGPQTVRFKYSPTSVKVGLFFSFMSAVSLLLLAAAWLWMRGYSPAADEGAAQRVAKNTVAPLGLQLLNKGIDLAFIMLALRMLGPDGQGKWYFAIQVAMIVEIVTNFGLNTLLTREVARQREDGNRYLWNTTILRLGLAGLAAPLVGAFLLLYRPMPRDTGLAIVLLVLGLVPSSISSGLSAVFMAFEVMVIPAVISTVTTLFKVVLGVAALLLGWGFVGLAGVSVVVNLITMGIFLALVAGLFFRPHPEPERKLQRGMLSAAYPLMVNHLLATLFFRADIFLVRHWWGDKVLGWYSVSFKFVDTVGIIPPTFTMALFPLMSRVAASSRDQLYRAYILAIKLLVSLALLVALAATILAFPLVSLMGGAAYLPHSAIALRIIVWYMPVGFVNSFTQYVLIALDQQRFVTKAYVIGLACGLAANLLLIPRYGYPAAAVVHLLSELALLIPFHVGVRRYLAPIPWARLLWRPLAAMGAAGGVTWLLRSWPELVVAPVAAVAYLALLLGLGTFDAADRALLLQVVPLQRAWARLQRLLPAHRPELGQP